MGNAYRDSDSEGRMMETGKIIEMLQDESYRLKQENNRLLNGPVAYTPNIGADINQAAEIAKQAANLLRRPIEVCHTSVYSLIIPPNTTLDELAILVKVALRVPQ